MRALPLLAALLAAALAAAQGGAFRVRTEGRLPLSVAQEADQALDRANRWLAAQPAPTNDLARLTLRRYALAPAGRPFVLERCALTPLEHALPPPPDGAVTNLTAALAQRRDDPKALLALATALGTQAQTPDPAWRERIALTLIETQRVTAQGGHWGGQGQTVWAILALRQLLGESPPITLRPPATSAQPPSQGGSAAEPR